MGMCQMIQEQLQLKVFIVDEIADEIRLDRFSTQLAEDIRQLDVISVQKLGTQKIPEGAKGDPFTIGALALVVSPALLPPLFAFLQSWLIERRKVIIEAPNGVKIEFVPDRKYSEAEIIDLVNSLNNVESPKNLSA
jgi:hypothetical protein